MRLQQSETIVAQSEQAMSGSEEPQSAMTTAPTHTRRRLVPILIGVAVILIVVAIAIILTIVFHWRLPP